HRGFPALLPVSRSIPPASTAALPLWHVPIRYWHPRSEQRSPELERYRQIAVPSGGLLSNRCGLPPTAPALSARDSHGETAPVPHDRTVPPPRLFPGLPEGRPRDHGTRRYSLWADLRCNPQSASPLSAVPETAPADH